MAWPCQALLDVWGSKTVHNYITAVEDKRQRSVEYLNKNAVENLVWQNAIAEMWFSQNSRENLVHSAEEFSEDDKYFRYRFNTASKGQWSQ